MPVNINIITIIKTYDNEEFHLKMPIETYILERDKRLALGKKTIYLRDFNYDLTISNVKSSRQVKQFIAIAAAAAKPRTLALM